MKLKLALLPLMLLALPGAVSSQQYSIDWFTIDGGGGTSTGGIYSVSGTIGQPDAGRLAGGAYVLDGGFWGVIQTPGAPLLNIERLGTGVRVFWSASPAADGYLLDETALLGGSTPGWTRVTSGYQTNATQISITVPSPGATRYFPLRKP